MTTSCNRDTFSIGCRSSFDSLSEPVLGGLDEGGRLESFAGLGLLPEDPAPSDLFSGETLSPARGKSPVRFLGGREVLLEPGRPPGLRPRPRPEDGRRKRLLSLLSSLLPSPSGMGPIRTAGFCSETLFSSVLRSHEVKEGLRPRPRPDAGRRARGEFSVFSSELSTPSGLGPIRELSASIRSRTPDEGRRFRPRPDEGLRPRLRRSFFSS